MVTLQIQQFAFLADVVLILNSAMCVYSEWTRSVLERL